VKEAIYGEEPSGLTGPKWGNNRTAKDGVPSSILGGIITKEYK